MAQRMELELDIESIVAEHKANVIRQDLMQRQAELQALEAQRHQLQDKKRRELEVCVYAISCGPLIREEK